MKRIFEAEDAIFDFDEANETILFTWKGAVSEDSVKKVLTRAIKASFLLEKVHWLIDRRQLEEYTPEARIWVKNDFLDNKGKEFIQKTDKIAAVTAHDAMAQVSSNLLIDLLKSVNSDIEYQEFDVVAPAQNWLIRKVEETEEPEKKKKKGFFRRG